MAGVVAVVEVVAIELAAEAAHKVFAIDDAAVVAMFHLGRGEAGNAAHVAGIARGSDHAVVVAAAHVAAIKIIFHCAIAVVVLARCEVAHNAAHVLPANDVVAVEAVLDFRIAGHADQTADIFLTFHLLAIGIAVRDGAMAVACNNAYIVAADDAALSEIDVLDGTLHIAEESLVVI